MDVAEVPREVVYDVLAFTETKADTIFQQSACDIMRYRRVSGSKALQ